MKVIRVLLAVVAVLWGAALSVEGIGRVVENELFRHRNVEGVARVVALDQQVSGPMSRQPGTIYYVPVLRFTANSGREVEFSTNWGRNPPEYEVGDEVAVVYSETNPDDVRTVSIAWLGLLLLGMGSVFLLLGGHFFYSWHRRRQLLRTGTPIRTRFFRVTVNRHTSFNKRNPWVIVSAWQDPATRAKRFFHSENLWTDPTPLLSETPILVYVDPKNPSRYAMDVAFLAKGTGESTATPLSVNEEARILRGGASGKQEDAIETPAVSSFVLDGSDLPLRLDGPFEGQPPTPKEVLKAARERVFVHFDRRKVGETPSIGHPTHAVMMIEGDFNRVKVSAKRLTCTLEDGEKCAIPWEAVFAVIPSKNRGYVWLNEIPTDACVAERAGSAAAEPVPGARQATDVALARHVPALSVNGDTIPADEFELLVDGEWFPGITSLETGSVLGFFPKLHLSGSTRPLLAYMEARARAEKHPVFLIELAYESATVLGRAAFTDCAWQRETMSEHDTLTFRPRSSGWIRKSKTPIGEWAW